MVAFILGLAALLTERMISISSSASGGGHLSASVTMYTPSKLMSLVKPVP